MVTFNPSKPGIESTFFNSSIDAIGKFSYLQSFSPSLSNFSVKYFFEKECDNGNPIKPNNRIRLLLYSGINEKYHPEDPPAWLPTGAVSYTHLRAHETPE